MDRGMTENKMLKTKTAKSSKTIRIGAVYISAGALVAILQVFGVLEAALASIDIEGMSPGAATWAGLALAIIGGVQIWLRMITSQPIGKDQGVVKRDSQEDKAPGP